MALSSVLVTGIYHILIFRSFATTQNLAFWSYWYRNKRLQMNF